MEWAKSLMMNSCDVLLVDRIDEKFDELDAGNVDILDVVRSWF